MSTTTRPKAPGRHQAYPIFCDECHVLIAYGKMSSTDPTPPIFCGHCVKRHTPAKYQGAL